MSWVLASLISLAAEDRDWQSVPQVARERPFAWVSIRNRDNERPRKYHLGTCNWSSHRARGRIQEPSMSDITPLRSNRRQILRVAGLWPLSTALAGRAIAGDDRDSQPVPVTNPRAISGDRIEPAWDERLTVTVGCKDGDL